MKQIKVEITPREWAEKRMQIITTSIVQEYGRKLENIDRDITLCGYVLKEDTEEPKKPITMDNLKIGMKGMLRGDLVDGEIYGIEQWLVSMKKGCEITIKGIEKSCFYIRGDIMRYSYSPEMIEYIIE